MARPRPLHRWFCCVMLLTGEMVEIQLAAGLRGCRDLGRVCGLWPFFVTFQVHINLAVISPITQRVIDQVDQHALQRSNADTQGAGWTRNPLDRLSLLLKVRNNTVDKINQIDHLGFAVGFVQSSGSIQHALD